jgi:hypothetical protein
MGRDKEMKGISRWHITAINAINTLPDIWLGAYL